MSLPRGIRKHHGRYQIRYWGKDGKQHTESRATITAAKLRQHEIAVELDKKTWRDPRDAKVPFGLYAESYLAQKLRLRPRTRDKYDSALRNHLEPAFGKTAIGAISRDAVQEWVASQVRDGLSPESVRGHYALLAAMLKRATADGITPRTPCHGIELPRVERQEQRFLDETQVEALAQSHDPRYQAAIYVAAYLGLRWQEIAGSRRALLDMRPARPATIRVVSTIERSGGRYRAVDHGKSAAARRTLKMPEFLREMLAQHLSEFKSEEWTFPAPEGGFLRYDNFYKRQWLPAVEHAQQSPLKFHELRHTAAAFMIDDGADPLQVKRRMGHEDVRTTFNLYGHMFPDREDELVAALDRRRRAGLESNVDQVWTKASKEVIELDSKRASEQGL